MPMPTPAGVPVAITVPAFNVMPSLSITMISVIPVIRLAVLESWRTSPFTMIAVQEKDETETVEEALDEPTEYSDGDAPSTGLGSLLAKLKL